MGAFESTPPKNTPTILLRLGGDSVQPPYPSDLSIAKSLSLNSCFRASNGDWYKVLSKSEDESFRIIPARSLFFDSRPPILKRALILPLFKDLTEEERKSLLIPKIISIRPPNKLHINIGDIIEGKFDTKFVCVDVEPAGGGVVNAQITELFLQGLPVQQTNKVRFCPVFAQANEEDRSNFRLFLQRNLGLLFLQRNLIIVDDFGKEWVCIEINEKKKESEKENENFILSNDSTYVSIGWTAEIAIPTECNHCYRISSPPYPEFQDFAFACKDCGFLVPNPSYPTWVQANRCRQGPAKQLLLKLRNALGDTSAADSRTLILGAIISRLPKAGDGITLDWRALDELAVRVLANPIETLNSTPESLINRLPVSTFRSPSGHLALSSLLSEEEEEEHQFRCEICLDSYADGAQLRTLPCFHRFHVSCCDNWLAISKACPLCKTMVDAEIVMS